MIDFSKAVISTKTDDMVKSTKLVTKRILYAVIIFIIPWIVSVLTIFIDTVGLDIGGDYKECLTNVDALRNGTITFEYFDEMYELSEKVDRDNHGSITIQKPNNGGASAEDRYRQAADDLIGLVKSRIGTNYEEYGGEEGVSWCGYFVTWALKNTEITGGATSSMSLYEYINKDGYATGIEAEASGFWPCFVKSSHLDFHRSTSSGGTYTPKKGDIVWFQWEKHAWDENNRWASHVGIVEYFDGTYVHTIEGNTGGNGSANNVVGAKKRDVKDIVAYGSWYK